MSPVSLTSRKFQPKHFFSFNFVLSYCKYILSCKINVVVEYCACFNLDVRCELGQISCVAYDSYKSGPQLNHDK